MYKNIANVIRGLAADGVQRADSGHPGMPVGCAEIGAVLFGEVLDIDPESPEWPDRDRFVLSAGHGSMLLYSLLHLSGFGVSIEDLKNFRQLGSLTPGHPEYGLTPGVETTTGPLGQGFGNAVGMALAERMLAARYNTDDCQIVDHYTYTIMSDGCMMEGISAEAASLAGHLGLGQLIAIYDDNEISIEGSTEITFTESVADRFRAYGWHVIEEVDGHDPDAIREAIVKAKQEDGRPSLIACRTRIACGAPNLEGDAASHGAPLGEDEVRKLKENIGLPADKEFYVPGEVRDFFEEKMKANRRKRKKWEEKFASWAEDNPELSARWKQALTLELPQGWEKALPSDFEDPVATRNASGAILSAISDEIPYVVGGSADLSPSTKTYLDQHDDVQSDNYNGRNLRFGVREHGMGAIVNGLVLHGGFRPYCSTFLVFSDYMRPTIRLSAMMKQPVLYVFTHDSIFVGEDGPTHQPVEQIEALRIIPNLKVIRPADAEETREAWIEAMSRTDGPTALILTRQSVPHVDKENGLSGFIRGGYTVRETGEKPRVILLASGSEVSLACEVLELLEKKDISGRVVSVPDRDQLAENEDYLCSLVGADCELTVALEAGVGGGWYRLLDTNSLVISIEEFGKSGPYQDLETEFGFVADDIAEKIASKL